jgi:ribosome-associated protein
MTGFEIRPGLVIPDEELVLEAVRSSGPGGQNVNKLSTKVALSFDIGGTRALSPDVKSRLRALAGHSVDTGGVLRITSQLTRSQAQNREDVLGKLRALVLRALAVPKKRKATKPTKGSKRRRLEDKRRTSQTKAGRGRVRDE